MTDHQSTPPVACALTDEQRENRVARVDKQLSTAFERAEEAPSGLVFVFDGTDEALADVASFVANERECCSFASYTIDVEPPYDSIKLTIDGPEGTKDQFDELIDLLDDTHPDRTVSERTPEEHRELVRTFYGDIASVSEDADDPSDMPMCCEPSAEHTGECGYDSDPLPSLSGEAPPRLGCGNTVDVAELSQGETVLDLGAGGGVDCVLAAEDVGQEGHVIGVDMTPEMVERARALATEQGVSNVEFRLGEIEHLPIADESVDVIVSNCVLNLVLDKDQAIAEAYRVLRPGGRLAIADIVSTGSLPEELATDPAAMAGCIAGATPPDELERMLERVGFSEIVIERVEGSEDIVPAWDGDFDVNTYIDVAMIEARK